MASKELEASLEAVWDEMRELEKIVRQLEHRCRLLVRIANPDKHPFTHLMLEVGASEHQVDSAHGLMEEAWNRIRSGDPMDSHQFEQRVYEIFPAKRGQHPFAESIVRTLNESHEYSDVFDYYREHGMNLTPGPSI
jgi:hypothetical protein